MKKFSYAVLALVLAVSAFSVPQGLADFKPQSLDKINPPIIIDDPVETVDPDEPTRCIVRVECSKEGGFFGGAITHAEDFESYHNPKCQEPSEYDVESCTDICDEHDSLIYNCMVRPVPARFLKMKKLR